MTDCGPTPLRLRYLGCDFTIHAAAPDLAREMAAFLTPHARPHGGGPGWSLYLAPGAPARQRSWNRARRWEFRYDPETPLRHVAQDAYCRLRRLAVAETPGCVILHAAAVMVEGRLLLLLGGKGAGKSFTAHRAALALGAGYVGSDKVCLWPEPGMARPLCSGLVGGVRLAESELARPPVSAAEAAVFDAFRTQGADPASRIGDKIGLSPMAYCAAAGIRPVPVAPVDGLVMMTAHGPGTLTRVPAADRARLRAGLNDHRLDDPDPGLPAGPPHPATIAAAVLDTVLDHAACWDWSGRVAEDQLAPRLLHVAHHSNGASP